VSALRSWLGGARRWTFDRESLLVCVRRVEAVPVTLDVAGLAVDSLADLEQYADGSRDGIARTELLALFRRRLAEGWRVVTRVDRGRLIHAGWWLGPDIVAIAGQGGRLPLDPLYPIQLDPGTAFLADGWTNPVARGQGLHARSLALRSGLAAQETGTVAVATAVLASNLPSRRNLERAGFRPAGAIHTRILFGRRRTWAA
jgi:hypothetical protein